MSLCEEWIYNVWVSLFTITESIQTYLINWDSAIWDSYKKFNFVRTQRKLVQTVFLSHNLCM